MITHIFKVWIKHTKSLFKGQETIILCSRMMSASFDSEPKENATMTDLANKTALVTGASRGMGRATALALAGAGARVIVHYGRNADEAKAVVDQIRSAG